MIDDADTESLAQSIAYLAELAGAGQIDHEATIIELRDRLTAHEEGWREYDVELDTDGEPPVVADGKLVGRLRPLSDGRPGGEVWVRFEPSAKTKPGTGSRYTITLPIKPPDGPPRCVTNSEGDV